MAPNRRRQSPRRPGQLTRPVRGANLIGNGPQILAGIDAVADDYEFRHGICGKEGQVVPVANGSPTLRIAEMTVCYDTDPQRAMATLSHVWPMPGIPGDLSAELPLPRQFEQEAHVMSIISLRDSEDLTLRHRVAKNPAQIAEDDAAAVRKQMIEQLAEPRHRGFSGIRPDHRGGN